MKAKRPLNKYYSVKERERVVKEFIPIIKHLAYKISRGFEERDIIDDLISAGVTGLLEAMDKYDPKKGIKLNTYAFLRIKGAMIDELRLRDWFPKNARLKTKKIEEVIKGLEAKLGRYPEEEEVAAELKMDMDEYFSMIRDYKNLSVLSIEDIYETVGLDRERIMRYALEEADDYEAYVEFHELESIIAKEFERLSEKQRIVLALYYQEDMNMKEIGAVLGVTEARVCQIHAQAILNLRTFLKEYL